jgi:hypothetical protein
MHACTYYTRFQEIKAFCILECLALNGQRTQIDLFRGFIHSLAGFHLKMA